MPTIKDVAKRASVSTATVSRVINDSSSVGLETRIKVQQAISQLKYIPNANARSLATANEPTIGVLLSEVSDPFYATVIHQIELAARRFGLKVLVGVGSQNLENAHQATKRLLSDGCSAIIVCTHRLSPAELNKLAELHNNLVFLHARVSNNLTRSIWFNNQLGAELVGQHIVELKHKKIAVLSADNRPEDAAVRLQGMKKKLQHHGITLDKKLVLYVNGSFEGGVHGAKQLLSTNSEFSAVVCFNDSIAAGVITTLKQHNYCIPDDISVIGFDDLPIAKIVTPSLTTVKYPIEIMARKATEVAWNMISELDNSNSLGYEYFPILSTRQSTSMNKAYQP